MAGWSIKRRGVAHAVSAGLALASWAGPAGAAERWMSDDGRFMAFSDAYATLVADDTNGVAGAFVYDRRTDGIERVSVDSSGAQVDAAAQEATSAPMGALAFSSAATNLVADVPMERTCSSTTDRQGGPSWSV